MNDKTQDPLHDFFWSEWEAPLPDAPPLSPDFSEVVLKRIADNRRKERLFNLGCISIALAGVVAVVVFVYPGYKQLHTVIAGISSFVTQTVSSGLISIPLLTYLCLLTALLWSLDGLLRKRLSLRQQS